MATFSNLILNPLALTRRLGAYLTRPLMGISTGRTGGNTAQIVENL